MKSRQAMVSCRLKRARRGGGLDESRKPRPFRLDGRTPLPGRRFFKHFRAAGVARSRKAGNPW